MNKSMRFAEDHTASYAEHKQLLVDLRTVLEGFDIDTDNLFSEYPSLSDEAPSDKNVESLRNVINIAISDIYPK